MSHTQMAAWYVNQYQSRVLELYQARGFMLRGMVTPAGRIEGKKAIWPTIGAAEAHIKVPDKAAIVSNGPTGTVEAELKTWEVKAKVEKFDESRIKANEKQAQQMTGVKALGRATDIHLLKTVQAAAGQFYDQNGNAFDLEHAEEMAVMLENKTLNPSGEIFIGLPPRFWSNLTKFKQFSNSDYVGPDLPYVRNMVSKSWNGIHFVRLPKTYFDETAPNGTDYEVLMWDKAAVGWANNSTLDSWWTWNNDYGRWDLRLESEGAAAVLQPDGVVRGRFSATEKVTFN